MIVTTEDNTSLEVVLNIELDAADVEPYLDKAYHKVVNKIRIPGFRKGKAPRSIVEGFVGKDHLLHEALEALVPSFVEKAIEQKQIDSFLRPDVDILELQPLSIKATIPLEPEVVLGDYQSLKVEEPAIEPVTNEQVDPVIERLRYESAPWQPVDRGVQFEDLITMDVEGLVGELQVASGKDIEYIPSMSNTLPMPGFSVYLEGMLKGQNKSFDLTIPVDYTDKDIAGRECHFQVQVTEIKTKELPELDDEFAKGVGEGYGSILELRETIRNNLSDATERDNKHQFHEKVLQQIVEGARVELSGIIIDREVDRMIDEQATARGSGSDMDGYLKAIGKSQDEIKEELRPVATDRLTRSLVLRKLSEDQKIEVNTQEIEEEIGKMTAQFGGTNEAIMKAFSSQEGRKSVESAIITRKTLDRLGEIACGNDMQEKNTVTGVSTKTSRQGGDKSVN